MEITKDTRIRDLMDMFPWLPDEAVKIDSQFEILKSPLARILVGKADLGTISEKSGIEVDKIIEQVKSMIAAHEGK